MDHYCPELPVTQALKNSHVGIIPIYIIPVDGSIDIFKRYISLILIAPQDLEEIMKIRCQVSAPERAKIDNGVD